MEYTKNKKILKKLACFSLSQLMRDMSQKPVEADVNRKFDIKDKPSALSTRVVIYDRLNIIYDDADIDRAVIWKINRHGGKFFLVGGD